MRLVHSEQRSRTGWHVVAACLTFETLLAQTLKALVADGWAVSVPSEPSERAAAALATAPTEMRTAWITRKGSLLSDVVGPIYVLRMLLLEHPDVVVAATPKAGPIGMVAAWIARVPVRIHECLRLRFEGENGSRRRALVVRDTEGWGVSVCSSRRVAEVSGGPRVSDPQSRLLGRSILQTSTCGQIGSMGPKPTQIWTDLFREVRGDIVDNCAVGSLTSAWHSSMQGGGRTVCMSRADAYFYWRAGMGLSNDACPKVQRGSRLDRNAKW